MYALRSYNGQLYAAADGKIYAYNGTGWVLHYDTADTSVKSLAVYNGSLFAGTSGGGGYL